MDPNEDWLRAMEGVEFPVEGSDLQHPAIERETDEPKRLGQEDPDDRVP